MNEQRKKENTPHVTMGNLLKCSKIQFLQRRLNDFKAQ